MDVVSEQKKQEDEAVFAPGIHLVAQKDRDDVLLRLGIPTISNYPKAKREATHIEHHAFYDYLAIYTPASQRSELPASYLECYRTDQYLIVLADDRVIERIEALFPTAEEQQKDPLWGLFRLFDHLMEEKRPDLEAIEDEIEGLEELAANKRPPDQSQGIIRLRKELLSLKRYFESLDDILDSLDLNDAHPLSDHDRRVFLAHKNKMNRMASDVRDLREYLTQVREAFQNQLDISLNETMRVFTVITAVFLPLTLIAGWYGMNLRMPELASPVTYPIIIGVSLVFLLVSLVYSKYKGWL
jgi:magnesium transporter